jgi:DNA mismatch endonuclease, patch repair protein
MEFTVADVLSQHQRRYCMSRIRGKDTSPELLVRRLVKTLGLSFQTNVAELPGKPDIVRRRSRQVIFVHGCFWHRHACRFGRVVPTTRRGFWQAKFYANQCRDTRNLRKLRRDGWSVLVVWECQLKDINRVSERVTAFLTAS